MNTRLSPEVSTSPSPRFPDRGGRGQSGYDDEAEGTREPVFRAIPPFCFRSVAAISLSLARLPYGPAALD
jgi:hypothetical protein